MSQAMRKLTGTIARTRTCCIFINQIREKIGVMFGNPETTTGGNALKFYATVRIDIRPSTFIKEGDNSIGRLIKVKVVKNKVAPPFMRAEFDIMFGEGISRSGEIIDLGVEYDVIKKSGAWFSYQGKKLGQGRDAVKRVIESQPELMEELGKKVMEAMKENKANEKKEKAKKNPALPQPETTRSETDDDEPIDDGYEPEEEAPAEDLFGDDFELDVEE